VVGAKRYAALTDIFEANGDLGLRAFAIVGYIAGNETLFQAL